MKASFVASALIAAALVGCSHAQQERQQPAAGLEADPRLCTSFNTADGEAFRQAIRDELIQARTASNVNQFKTVIALTRDAERRLAACSKRTADPTGGLFAAQAEAYLLEADAEGAIGARANGRAAVALAKRSIEIAMRAPAASWDDRRKFTEIDAQIRDVAAHL